MSKRRNCRRSKQIVKHELRAIVETPVTTMADASTMSELLQALTEGYEDAIVIPAILADNFELKLEKEPPRSVLTWEDLVSKFVNHFFPPSKTINLKNDITNFQQRFDESFGKAWDRFKDLLPAGGNLLNHTPRDALTIIENKSKEIVKELVLMNKATQQATVKAIEETCVTCGGPHPYYECLATGGNTFDACAAIGTTIKERQSPLGSGSRPIDTVANPRGDVKAITTRSGVTYERPSIPPTSSSLSKEVEQEPEVTRDKVQTTIDVHSEELTLRVNDEAITFKVGHTLRYSRNYYEESVNQINIIDFVCKERNGDFSTYPDELSTLDDDFDSKGDIALIEKLLNEDPSLNLPPMKIEDLQQVDVTTMKPSIEEPPELELKDLPPHLDMHC
nr:reverse transcriptase domain-containing protein [Tanacetum cinerariifolium]